MDYGLWIYLNFSLKPQINTTQVTVTELHRGGVEIKMTAKVEVKVIGSTG